MTLWNFLVTLMTPVRYRVSITPKVTMVATTACRMMPSARAL